MLLPAGSGSAVGTLGAQSTTALAGSPLTMHDAAKAALGPLFTHWNAPDTVEPGVALSGNVAVATRSALAVAAVVNVALLSAMSGSDVLLPA